MTTTLLDLSNPAFRGPRAAFVVRPGGLLTAGRHPFTIVTDKTGGFVPTPAGPGFACNQTNFLKHPSPMGSYAGGSVMAAYLYRYDASGNENGELYAESSLGHEFQHAGTALNFRKAGFSTLLTAAVGQPDRGVLCTAGYTYNTSSAATQMTLFFNGHQVATSSTAQTFLNGTSFAAWGLYPTTTTFFGQHTLLAGVLYTAGVDGSGRSQGGILTAQEMWEFDLAARLQFAPLLLKRPAVVFGAGAAVPVNAALADTLTWTDSAVLAGVDAALADALTWTPTIPPPGDDDFSADTLTLTDSFLPTDTDASLADALTWTDSADLAGVDVPALTDTVTFADADDPTGYDWALADAVTWGDAYAVTGYDWPLADTLTWTPAEILEGVSASTADALTWTDEALAAGADVSQHDTLTWTEDLVLSIDVAFADTLTFTDLDRVVEDGDMPDDTLTLDDAFVGLPEIETLAVDLLLWADATEEDQFVQQAVTWLDLFVYDGEVFPPLDGTWADALTWDMRPSGMTTPTADTLTWGDAFTLPAPTVNTADTLVWRSAFGVDPNLLGAARYRR